MTAFFYLDLLDARRRAALLAMAVTRKKPTVSSLNRRYAEVIARVGKLPLNTAGTARIVSRGPVLRAARARGLVNESVAPTYPVSASAPFARGVEHGLLFLRLQHPPLRALCDLLITDILVWPSDKVSGGSSAKLLGIIWLAPSANLTSIDIAEAIVHEMIHLNLHLANMTFGLYTEAPGSAFSAYSAVLARRRPYHHAFHSACVAVAVIYFRLLFGLDGEIDALCASLRRCTTELLDHRPAFTKYAWRAIEAAHAFSKAPRLTKIPVHKNLVGAAGGAGGHGGKLRDR